ncbi:MAG: Rieske (2Fe-2S) protein [Thermosynechococcaceae cyanobacterium]
MGWTKAIAVAELAPGTRQVVKVGNRNILLLNQSGEFYAVDNRCPHLNLPMKKGKVQDDCSIVCPWHRSVFDLKSGEAKTWTPFPPVVGKALGMISEQKNLPVFPTRVEDGSLWVEVNG